MKRVKNQLAAALKEICSHKRLDAVTVTEITQHASVTRQAFYKYYIDKYDLAKAIHLQEYYHALDALEPSTASGPLVWSRVARVWFDVIKAKPQFYQNLYLSDADGEFKNHVRTYITNFYMKIIQFQNINQIDPDTTFMIQLYLAGATEKITQWIQNGARLPIEELNRLLYLSMPDRVRNMIVFNEIDIESAKKLARDACTDYALPY